MFHFICKHTVIDKSAAADCFFYLYTLFCIWIDSYFYCPIYFPHLISTCLQMISIAISEQYVLFYYNTSHPWEQVFSFLFIKFFWAFMLRSTIHLTTCRGRRILVIYYVKFSSSPTWYMPRKHRSPLLPVSVWFLRGCRRSHIPGSLRHCRFLAGSLIPVAAGLSCSR